MSETVARHRPVKTFADLVGPERQHEVGERIARLFSGEPEASSAEWQLRRKDGSPIWVILSLALAGGEVMGETLAIGHVQDISTRKRAEDELRLSRERLAEAERVAQMGSWEWDITNDQTTWSEGMFQIYGLNPEEHEHSLSGWQQRIYPDDREQTTRTVERALTERSSFTLEYRAIRGDGRVRTLRSRGDVVVDDSGQPIRLVGIAQDITDAKLTQEALEETSSDLERRATELQRLALRTATEPQVAPHAPLTPRQQEILRTDRPGSHQRGDRRTTRDHRGHRQMARQANPGKDRLIQPRRSYRPLPARTRPAAQSKSGDRARGERPPAHDATYLIAGPTSQSAIAASPAARTAAGISRGRSTVQRRRARSGSAAECRPQALDIDGVFEPEPKTRSRHAVEINHALSPYWKVTEVGLAWVGSTSNGGCDWMLDGTGATVTAAFPASPCERKDLDVPRTTRATRLRRAGRLRLSDQVAHLLHIGIGGNAVIAAQRDLGGDPHRISRQPRAGRCELLKDRVLLGSRTLISHAPAHYCGTHQNDSRPTLKRRWTCCAPLL